MQPMSCLYYHQQELHLENVNLKKIAETFGTPCYVYSRAAIVDHWQQFTNAFKPFPHRICYAVKANSNLSILRLLAELGSGFDIVSLGELERVIAAHGNPKKIVFSGVGKKSAEIERAAKLDIFCFNVESEAELDRLAFQATQLNKTINIALRINPDVNPLTHEHMTTGKKENKFGIDINEVLNLCHKLTHIPQLQLIGLACHIGSQITELEPFLLALDQLLKIYTKLIRIGFNIRYINMGGGLGIVYHEEHPPTLEDYAKKLKSKLSSYPVELILEPGRYIVGHAGILLTRIEYLKQTEQKNFAVVDAGMNDLLRPVLYHAWQNILPVEQLSTEKKHYDIVGPVCESADFLGKNRELAIRQNDLLAIDAVGAYGFSMSSNYNSRCRPPEILVDTKKTHLIRRRETIEELFALEKF